MSQMNRIIEINGALLCFLKLIITVVNRSNLLELDADITCEAGATWDQINKELETRGMST